MRGIRCTRWSGVFLAAALCGGIGAAGADGPAAVAGATMSARGDERLEYRWRVQGFFGALASLFFPAEGDGCLTRTKIANGNFENELLISSDADDEPDFFRYGAEIDFRTGATARVWSSQLWRGKRKDKSLREVPAGAVDVASAIELLRRDRPRDGRRMEIWSDGKLYPVLVEARGAKRIALNGKTVETMHVVVRPLVEPERRVWKGELDLWLAQDAASTPVEILVSRPPAQVLLSLKQYP